MTAPVRHYLIGSLVSVALVAAITGVIALLKTQVDVLSLPVLYVLAVLPIAVFWGVVLAVLVSVVSALTVAFLFLPPLYSFRVADLQEALALVTFLVTAVVVSELAARLRRQTKESARLADEQSALRRVATLVAEAVPPTGVFEAVTREVGLLSGADLARMERYEPDETVSGVAGWSRTDGDQLAVGTRFELQGVSIAALVRQTGGPVRVGSFAGASGPIAEEARALGIRSSVGCPIVVDGRIWGVIAASSRREAPFPENTESQIAEFTELVATAISNAQARDELAASRTRIVAAADETRRRMERDLHDGAQQRLVSLALQLRAAQAAVPPDFEELAGELDGVAAGLTSALDELREYARGIHPAILTEGGLAPALRTLVRRSAVPVSLSVRAEERLPEPVEVGAYYVSEALANAAKHAGASVAAVDVEALNGVLRISVRDDGVGGADFVRGSGLVGLKDRVETLGGRISLESPHGAGTCVEVELPLRADASSVY